MFDLMAYAATVVPASTPSSLLQTQPELEVDDDMTKTGHISKCQKLEGEDVEPKKNPTTVSQSKQIAEDTMDRMLKAMDDLLKTSMDCLKNGDEK